MVFFFTIETYNYVHSHMEKYGTQLNALTMLVMAMVDEHTGCWAGPLHVRKVVRKTLQTALAID
jgi:hypothetical protein